MRATREKNHHLAKDLLPPEILRHYKEGRYRTTNRSDGYLGSDFSGDDGFFFDGKPEDFIWKLVRKQDALRMVDPESIGGQLPVEPL